MPSVLEVGPATVRALHGGSGEQSDVALVSAAVDGIDDPVALIGDRPVGVADLWRSLISTTLGTGRDSVVVVHPSWWSRARVDRVIGATTAVAVGGVVAMSRSELVRRGHPETGPVIEIAGELIAVCSGSTTRVLDRADLGPVVDTVVALAESDVVLLDAPPGIPGSAHTAALIRKALSRHGFTVCDADVANCAADVVTPRRAVSAARLLIAVTAVMLVIGAAVGLASRPPVAPPPADQDPVAQAEILVEGRIAVGVPPDWIVERVTGGPGSRRMQVRSAVDADLALHITQTYAPETTLAQAAAVLQRGITEQDPGVFVDFDPADEVAGRPAVTYREIRPGRVIRWVVVLAGSTRISVGCQSAPDRQDAIREPCEHAVRSAQETGTDARR
ncbi:MAG: type VII secretion-associated protein [Mycobacterium sp.]|nr:type VII secretion-associated protein [Mycobacterium sp.]